MRASCALAPAVNDSKLHHISALFSTNHVVPPAGEKNNIIQLWKFSILVRN